MIDWIPVAIAVIKGVAAFAAWMERQAVDKEKFNKAIALELQAVSRARAKAAGIERLVRELSDEELGRKLSATRRPPKGV